MWGRGCSRVKEVVASAIGRQGGGEAHAWEEMSSLLVLATAGQVSLGAGQGPVSTLFPSTHPSPFSHAFQGPLWPRLHPEGSER